MYAARWMSLATNDTSGSSATPWCSAQELRGCLSFAVARARIASNISIDCAAHEPCARACREPSLRAGQPKRSCTSRWHAAIQTCTEDIERRDRQMRCATLLERSNARGVGPRALRAWMAGGAKRVRFTTRITARRGGSKGRASEIEKTDGVSKGKLQNRNARREHRMRRPEWKRYGRQKCERRRRAVCRRSSRRGVPDGATVGGAASTERQDAAQRSRLRRIREIRENRQKRPLSLVGRSGVRAGQRVALDERRRLSGQ